MKTYNIQLRAHIVIQSVPEEKAAETVSAFRKRNIKEEKNEADISAKEEAAS